ncbi:MAG: MerR family transcriptional regulator [Streptosporangiaceae bacterium]|nr:MerR family transcriptional regulator [Streptosporangiaceae bacterium]MBV9857339.1 MerR family transcriptional regulator [Streptosporangiaceae bacterium]
MLMGELSRRSGVPVATIKFYLREGLLPPGTPTAATRASYGEDHLRRLRLIRALLEVGEVSVATIRTILAVVDDRSVGVHQMLGAVQYALGPRLTPPTDGDPHWEAAGREADDLISDMGWIVAPEAPARTLLTATLAALRRTGSAPSGAGLHAYAEALSRLAASEVASLEPAGSPESPAARIALTESAVVGMVLHERVIIALRRLAQEDASARRYG